MAHRESIQSPTLSALLHGAPFIWTVSSSVGYGCRNKTEDVLLVQFFLNTIIETLYNETIADVIAGTIEDKDPFSKIPKKLEPDGIFGGNTWGAIKWLQKVCGYCVVDGTISDSDGTQALTPKKKKWYTIHMLNWYYRYCCPQYFADICCDPTIHPLLRKHLSGPLPDLV